MEPVTILAALLGLVVLGVVLGAVHRTRSGRVASVPSGEDPAIDPGELVPGAVLGTRATVVQFSTDVCTRCPAVRRMLGELAQQRPGLAHLDVDLTHRPDLAARFRVRQTPTLLLLDRDGVPRSRIGGAPTRAALTIELDRLQET
ncbi:MULTISPECIES: thioredoxin family protein [unclassified Rathayibacter]|uniref:thioredoxin family protein n=1 Tax=unclassified Rathayibacter TaxID=2609250 RepID=UPI000CE80C3B|nr:MULTISPECIES: thioredoxin family protein [unclassified Rathayibacter]PPI21396.1 thioredoxin [Rathayibacter sp. AY1B5]PPI22918.1 thioredoxin [Rathayibacter sp. AY1B6]PPI33985.1 thioredoxin [Rathayibacter sp. AY1B1]